MSQILNVSPFDPSILGHNEAQLDFILEMYSLDYPDKLKFNRPGRASPGVEEVQAEAEWANVLRGKAYSEYMAPRMPDTTTMEALRRIAGFQSTGGVTPMGKRK